MRGSPFIMYRVKMDGFGRTAPSDRSWVEIASEKVVNCYGASTMRLN